MLEEILALTANGVQTYTQTKSRVEVAPVRAISAYGSPNNEGSAILVPLTAIQKINSSP